MPYTGAVPLPPSPSFRKRHPVFFGILAIFFIVLVLSLVSAVYSYADRKGILSGPRLGMVTIEGFIDDADKVARWVEELRKDSSVKGVLLRIDSPGGAVAPSQEMYQAVARLAEVKPVVVSMGTVAASGGYYIAVAGHEIYANPSTLTGSIGVKMQLMTMEGLMDKAGLKSENITTGALKDAGSPFRPMTAEERVYLGEIVADMQDEFERVVADGRKLPRETVRSLADGRAFTGRQALAVKLVDALGDKTTALKRLMTLCGMDEQPEILSGPDRSQPWWREALSAFLQIDARGVLGKTGYTFYY